MAFAADLDQQAAPVADSPPACTESQATFDPHTLPAGTQALLDFSRCAMRQGKLTQALVALQRVLAVDPANPVALQLHSELLAALAARNSPNDAPASTGRGTTSGWYGVQVGQDSNLNSGTDVTEIRTPHLNTRNFTLNKLLVAQQSSFAGFAGEWVYTYSWSNNARLYAGLSGTLRYNTDNYTYLPHNYNVAAGFITQLKEAHFTAEVSTSQNWVTGYQLRDAQAFKAQVSYPVSESLQAGAFATTGNNYYPQYAQVRTNEQSGGVSLSYAPYRLGVALYKGVEQATGAIRDLDRKYDGVFLQWTYPVNEKNSLNISYGQSNHDYQEYSKLFLIYRKDKLEDIAVEYRHELAKDWSITPRFIQQTNQSNLPLTRYSRSQWLVELKKDF